MSSEQKPPVVVAAEDIAGFTKSFTASGFTGVKIAQVPLPRHLCDWLRKDREFAKASDEELGAALPYLSVESAQGAFGLFTVDFPAIDLTGTGLSVSDFDVEVGPGMPPLVTFFDDEPIVLFCKLLAARAAPAA